MAMLVLLLPLAFPPLSPFSELTSSFPCTAPDEEPAIALLARLDADCAIRDVSELA